MESAHRSSPQRALSGEADPRGLAEDASLALSGSEHHSSAGAGPCCVVLRSPRGNWHKILCLGPCTARFILHAHVKDLQVAPASDHAKPCVRRGACCWPSCKRLSGRHCARSSTEAWLPAACLVRQSDCCVLSTRVHGGNDGQPSTRAHSSSRRHTLLEARCRRSGGQHSTKGHMCAMHLAIRCVGSLLSAALQTSTHRHLQLHSWPR